MAIEIKIPDIGNFDDVDVIEVLVAVGDEVSVEDPLLTLESDKASMDVPSPEAGTITEVLVKEGDKVQEGVLVFKLEPSSDVESSGGVDSQVAGEKASSPASETPPPASAPPTSTPQEVSQTAVSSVENADCDVLVLGSGPGGYSAAFRAADLGLKVILVERYSTLGGVCLNVGCIPSKALLKVANVIDEAKTSSDFGVSFGETKIDLDKLRGYKESVVGKLTGGLGGMAKMRKVEVVQGSATFTGAHTLEVVHEGQKVRDITFNKAIIAAGSEAVELPFMPEDPRIIDSTGALALEDIPENLLVIGGGIIGLEMATVYSTLGSKVTIVEFTDGFMPGADRDLVKVFERFNKDRFEKVMFGTKVVAAEALDAGIKVSFEGKNAIEPTTYDKVLVAVGRRPNGLAIGAEKAGVVVDERGFIPVNRQMQTNVPHIFAIGDIIGQPMLAHKAVHEGHVAAEVCAGHKRYFDVRQIPSVAYADPEIAWAGLTETEAKAQKIPYEVSVFPWVASGKAIANNRDEGFTKLLYDPETKQILGGGIVGTHAGDLIGEICLAVEMGADNIDMAHTIHPHPTLVESLGMAAANIDGACTDLPPKRKK